MENQHNPKIPNSPLKEKLQNQHNPTNSVENQQPPTPPLHLLLFRIQQHHLALPTSEVIEVLPRRESYPIPNTPPFLPGVILWQCQIIALFDLSPFLQLPPQNPKRIVVVGKNEDKIGLLTEQVLDVTEFQQQQLQNPLQLEKKKNYLPKLLAYSKAYIKLDNNPIFLLDLEKILTQHPNQP